MSLVVHIVNLVEESEHDELLVFIFLEVREAEDLVQVLVRQLCDEAKVVLLLRWETIMR